MICMYVCTVSRFPVNRQSFRTYHLPQVTGILPALSATLFGVCRCATCLYCSSVFWGTLCGECLCLLLMLFVCFFGDVVWCVVESVTYIVLAFFGQPLVCGCVCYLYRFRVFLGEKKMVQRIVEVVAEYEDRVNLTASSARAT